MSTGNQVSFARYIGEREFNIDGGKLAVISIANYCTGSMLVYIHRNS